MVTIHNPIVRMMHIFEAYTESWEFVRQDAADLRERLDEGDIDDNDFISKDVANAEGFLNLYALLSFVLLAHLNITEDLRKEEWILVLDSIAASCDPMFFTCEALRKCQHCGHCVFCNGHY